MHAPHDLAQRRVLEVGEPFRRPRRAWQEKIPESFGARLRLQLLDELRGHPGIAFSAVRFDLLVEAALVRVDVRVHEAGELRLERRYFVRVGKIHAVEEIPYANARAVCRNVRLSASSRDSIGCAVGSLPDVAARFPAALRG